ncbi:MAG: HD domain-containing protein [Clostridiales bacterium]|nr:HD domain-containing protein [Clostridiales bacterium]
MKNFDVRKVVENYYLMTELKNKVRSGWLVWNVSNTRLETVAEHVFGAMHLAELIYSESDIELDIVKVKDMLLWHETEEVLIPDYTPYDDISREEWDKMGREAVRLILQDLKIGPAKIELIDEFNAHETAEAKFAFLCDKLECTLQVKKYSDGHYCTIEGGRDRPKNDPEVQQHIANGAKSVADVFIAHDMPKYEGTAFGEIANFLKSYDATTVHNVFVNKDLPEDASNILKEIAIFLETYETQ